MEIVIACCAAAGCVALTTEPARFTDVKRRYGLLREHLRKSDDPRWKLSKTLMQEPNLAIP